MKLDQHTVVLNAQNGFYEEYVLDSTEAGNVMPGAIVAQKSTNAVQADGIKTAVIASQVTNGVDIDLTELLIVGENALIGKSINHKAIPGEVTPVYRPVSGDRFLVRAIAGSYVAGDPLYLTQTNNGIYLTKTATNGTGNEVKAYAVESYVIPATTNTSLTPPFFYDVVDDSTTERPSTTRLNGGVVNLLAVRIA